MSYFLLLVLALPVGSSRVLTLPHAWVSVTAVSPAHVDQSPDFLVDYVCSGRPVALGLPVARSGLSALLVQVDPACP